MGNLKLGLGVIKSMNLLKDVVISYGRFSVVSLYTYATGFIVGLILKEFP